jgi:hypothetical protein
MTNQQRIQRAEDDVAEIKADYRKTPTLELKNELKIAQSYLDSLKDDGGDGRESAYSTSLWGNQC